MEQGNNPFRPHSLIQFFNYKHLPEHLGKVSELFFNLATTLDQTLPISPEKTTALRKLLEAKDCAVRAVLYVNDFDKKDIEKE